MVLQSGQFRVVEERADQTSGQIADLIERRLMPMTQAIEASAANTEYNEESLKARQALDNAVMLSSEADPREALQVFKDSMGAYAAGMSELRPFVRDKIVSEVGGKISMTQKAIFMESAAKIGKQERASMENVLTQTNSSLLETIANATTSTGVADAIDMHYADLSYLRDRFHSSGGWDSKEEAEAAFTKLYGTGIKEVAGFLLNRGNPSDLAQAKGLIEGKIPYTGKGAQMGVLQSKLDQQRVNNANANLIILEQMAVGSKETLAAGDTLTSTSVPIAQLELGTYVETLDLWMENNPDNTVTGINKAQKDIPGYFIGRSYPNEDTMDAFIKDNKGTLRKYAIDPVGLKQNILAKQLEKQNAGIVAAAVQVEALADTGGATVQTYRDAYVSAMPKNQMYITGIEGNYRVAIEKSEVKNATENAFAKIITDVSTSGKLNVEEFNKLWKAATGNDATGKNPKSGVGRVLTQVQ